MSMPKWLAQEIDDLAHRAKSGELDREEAVGAAADHAIEKDEEFVRELVIAHLSGKLDAAVRKLRKSDERKVEREMERFIAGDVPFENICSDYWPRDTYGPRTPLEELGHHDEEMLGLAERHMNRAQERHQRFTELVNAAGGDLTTAWEDAERKRLGIDEQGGQAVTG